MQYWGEISMKKWLKCTKTMFGHQRFRTLSYETLFLSDKYIVTDHLLIKTRKIKQFVGIFLLKVSYCG